MRIDLDAAFVPAMLDMRSTADDMHTSFGRRELGIRPCFCNDLDGPVLDGKCRAVVLNAVVQVDADVGIVFGEDETYLQPTGLP